MRNNSQRPGKGPSPMNREQRHLEEYAAAKAAALKMAAKLTAKEKGCVVTATRRALTDDVRRDLTRQRRFERRFLSPEFPKDDGMPYDYSFDSREVNRLVRHLDVPHRERLLEARFRAALVRLVRHSLPQETLCAIRRHRRRPAILAALGITAGAYRRRFCDILRILALSPTSFVSGSTENASPSGESALLAEDARVRGACEAEAAEPAPAPASRRSSISAKAASTRPNASFTVLGHPANTSATRRRAPSTNLQ